MTRRAGWQTVACFSEQLAEERGQRAGTTAGRRDKRGSPVEPQAIGMAWVLACRSVEARAVPEVFARRFREVFGTIDAGAVFEGWP